MRGGNHPPSSGTVEVMHPHRMSSSYSSSTFWLPSSACNAAVGSGGDVTSAISLGSGLNEHHHSTSMTMGADDGLLAEYTVVEPFPGRNQCFKLLKELNRQVSTYHHLATALGGSSDGQHLRGLLKRTRRRAREVASLVHTSLPADTDGDRMNPHLEIGKFWGLLWCLLYILGLEMQRTLHLQQLFALHTIPTGFINTGIHEFQCPISSHPPPNGNHHHHHHHQHSTGVDADYEIPLVDRLSLETAEISQLQKEVQELESALQEWRSNVDVESYLLMASQLEGVPLGTNDCQHQQNLFDDECSCSYHPVASSILDGMEYDDISSRGDDTGLAAKQRRCLCFVMVVIVGVFVLAIVLGASVAFPFVS